MLWLCVYWAVRSMGLELEEMVAVERFGGNLSSSFFFFFLKKRALMDKIDIFKLLLTCMCTEDLGKQTFFICKAKMMLSFRFRQEKKKKELKYQIRFECISSLAVPVSPRDATYFHS